MDSCKKNQIVLTPDTQSELKEIVELIYAYCSSLEFVANEWAHFNEEEVLQNLQPQATAEAQLQALAYLSNLKSSHNFWRLAARLLLGDKNLDDNVVFFLWQAIEQHIGEPMAPNEEEQRVMREFISLWIMKQDNHSAQSCIRNKAAQVFTMVFLRDYLTRWPTFFHDLMKPWSCGVNAVDNFLRVLKTICIELADQDLVRSQSEIDRNTQIKNRMREMSIPQLVEVWFELLKTKELSSEILCQCLEVVGLYISWIDIGLIATESFMPLFVNLWKNPSTREAVADCLNSMVNKGMAPLLKLDLICGLVAVFHAENLFEPLKIDPTDFSFKLAQLINSIGMNLLAAHAVAPPMDVQRITSEITSGTSLHTCTVYMLAFLSNDDDDVSAAVMEFAKAYVRLLRLKAPMLTEDEQNHLLVLLHTIANKMKYDKSYSFDRNGEEEAEFMEYRQQLKGLLDNLASLNLDVVMEFTHKTVLRALPDWMSLPFEEVEVAITLLYYMGELSCENHFRQNGAKVSRIQEMMRTMVTCGVSGHSKPIVILQYLETVVRYEKFFLAEPEHIPNLLLTFLDHRGMRHEDCKVRSRCAFLFTKFIKGLKNHIQAFTKDLLFPLQDLLTPPNGHLGQQWVSQDDQLYLYEAAGILIVSSKYSVNEKAATFQELLCPVCEKFNQMLGQLQSETNDQCREALVEHMCHAMAVTSRASKAFPNLASMRLYGCEPIFVECLQTFLPCLQINGDIAVLQAGMRQFLHRMVVCLEELLIPFIPKVSEGLLRDSNIHSILEYLPLIIQIISKFKKPMLQYMLQAFMPIVNAVFTALAMPIEVNDEQAKREKQLLRRNYFSFIAVIVNEMIDVLNAQKVEAVEHVTLSVIRGAVDFPDPVGQKTCFVILRKLVVIWGGKNAPVEFINFTIKHIVPACFMVPMKPNFDLGDSQTIAALGEIATCMLTIYEKQGEEFVKYLREQYMPTLLISPEQIEKYCNALTKDKKHFKLFTKVFFLQFRT